jgi:hypothetical protein
VSRCPCRLSLLSQRSRLSHQLLVAPAHEGRPVQAAYAVCPRDAAPGSTQLEPSTPRQGGPLVGWTAWSVGGQQMDKSHACLSIGPRRTVSYLLLCWQPQRNSNPCLNLERVTGSRRRYLVNGYIWPTNGVHVPAACQIIRHRRSHSPPNPELHPLPGTKQVLCLS